MPLAVLLFFVFRVFSHVVSSLGGPLWAVYGFVWCLSPTCSSMLAQVAFNVNLSDVPETPGGTGDIVKEAGSGHLT